MKISYENFKKQMTDIVNFQELSDSISDTMRVYNSKSKDNAEIWFPSLICNTVELLEMLTNDTKSQWISYYVFELDCGKDYKDGSITDKDGGIIKLQTIDDLWNLLKSEESYMIFEEIQQDLFTVPQGYYLAHCISAIMLLVLELRRSLMKFTICDSNFIRIMLFLKVRIRKRRQSVAC
jgi:hypothetical protein